METLKRCWRHWWVKLLVYAAAVFLVVYIGNWISNYWAFWDRDPARGAVVVSEGGFGPNVSKIVYLDGTDANDPAGQGWAPKDSLWFDNTTQGSDLIPYDFFLVLKKAGTNELIRSDNLMNTLYRYLPRKATSNNPDALPIGMVKDNYQGRNFMGFTCAACHSGQVNYKGTGIRIDGAPAMADMDKLLTDMAAALREANSNPKVQAQFIQDVKNLKGDYSSDQAIKDDLKKYAIRLTVYRTINHSPTKYGYARLDAFGRIYNQVLEYVLTVPDVQEALDELKFEGKVKQSELDAAGITAMMNKFASRKTELDGDDRDELFAALQTSPKAGLGLAAADVGADGAKKGLSLKQILYFRNKIFNAPDAPVSYPFLWDIPQHDYVQWNGLGGNSGLGPLGRNVGEVVGVFGSMNWKRGDSWSIAGLVTGQGFTSHPIDFTSSVNVHNLALIEDHLKNLRSPVWPEKIFGKINTTDTGKPIWQRGKDLFERYCASCHANIDRADPTRRIVAHMSAVRNVKTDDKMAANGVGDSGYSGILRNQYATIAGAPGAMLLNKKAPVAGLLTYAVTGVVATPDPDKWFGQRFAEWLYDVLFSLRNNNIKASLKTGDYDPDTTSEPVQSLVAYKGRALDGIWATAPYLHNGSVPTLYDLLLPVDQRPKSFMVGSREFDPKKVGFATSGYNGFPFFTNIPGNSNAGHDYGTVPTPVIGADGTVEKNSDGTDKTLPPLTDQQRWDLVEYLKSL
ncbi:MAG TPA: di-heme-cytochrome C peroxidase [Rhizomicrobium sp.]|nr:di-heme-cytochrome C peroxidase [Rhizomicrobium sp.]